MLIKFFDQERIISQIQESLTSFLVGKEKEKFVSLEIIRVLKRPFSFLLFLQVRISNNIINRYVAKTIIHHPINKTITEGENQAVNEYTILKELYPRFQEIKKCSVPRPVLLIQELETYIMEFVEGMSLAEEFRYARFFFSL